jgi:hypothetical protein
VMNLDDKLAEIHEIPFPAVSDFLIRILAFNNFFEGDNLCKYYIHQKTFAK